MAVACRKRLLCRCGCRGWCSLWRIYDWLADSLRHAADGAFPTERHDGSEFLLGSDDVRRAMAGQGLGSRFVVTTIKGDWDATTVYLGFPTSADRVHPCSLCCASRETLHHSQGVDIFTCPWGDKSSAMIEQAVAACEITVCVGWEDHRKIIAALFYDKGKGSAASRGRALKVDLPSLGLCKKDRLEPSRYLMDVGDLDALNMYPIVISFWRRSAETMARHRCPLIMPHLGLTLDRCLGVDSLHTLALGVYQYFLGDVVQRLFDADFWKVGEANKSTRSQLSTMRMRADLFSWYSAQEKSGRRDIHRCSDLSAEMFGTSARPSCSLKGAETVTFLEFMLDLLQKNAASGLERVDDLVRTARALRKLHELPKQQDDRLAPLRPSVVQEHLGKLEPLTSITFSDIFWKSEFAHNFSVCPCFSFPILGKTISEGSIFQGAPSRSFWIASKSP